MVGGKIKCIGSPQHLRAKFAQGLCPHVCEVLILILLSVSLYSMNEFSHKSTVYSGVLIFKRSSDQPSMLKSENNLFLRPFKFYSSSFFSKPSFNLKFVYFFVDVAFEKIVMVIDGVYIRA